MIERAWVVHRWRRFSGAWLIRRAGLLALTACVLPAAGCAVTSSVVPAAYASATSPDGTSTATTYVIEGGGEVALWSRGALREAIDGKLGTLLHVGFSITNGGSEALRFDAGRLRLIDVVARTPRRHSLQPTRVEGEALVAPGSRGQIDAYFALPAATWPDDVRSFGVEWALERDIAEIQRTAFIATSHLRRPFVVYRNGHYWAHHPSAPGYVGPYSHASPPSRYGWDMSRRGYGSPPGPRRIQIRPAQP